MSKIYNNWRVFLAEKTFQDFSGGEKDKWIHIAHDQLISDKEKNGTEEGTINKELYDLIDVSYANIGGHVSFRSADDMPSDYTDWEAVDVDSDPQPDAVIFGKGDKYSGGAADGSVEGKKAMLDKTAEFLNTSGKYGEFSDALAHIMMTRYNIPSVNDEQVVRDILKKDIEWVGANPNGKYPNHTGWYIRDLGKFGKEDKHMKIMLGVPAQATALKKIEDEVLAEIKDYSTGKKYFISKFQDKVRKSNIKAKKKLIGTGNEGALSGTGPLEEEYVIEERIVKQGKEYCLKSKNKNKNLGCYPTKAGAKKREKQVQYFKHMKESMELDEGILDWLGLTKKQEEEKYIDYSQPIPDIPLWIGAFPLKEMDEARKKFDVIILMANDVVDLAQRFQSQKYEHYKAEGFIIDKYAIQDVETDPGGEDQKIKDAGQLALSLVAPKNDEEPKKVLITCAQGLNRSAAATCLTLQGLSISAQDAYQAIQTSRTAKKQALEMIKAQQSQSRPRTLGNQAFMLHGHPHERFLKLVGIDTENVALEERIRKLIAQTLKEYYNR